MDSNVIILSNNTKYFLILVLLFALYISYRIIKRMVGDDKVGCASFAYVSAVYLSLCSLSLPFVIMTSTSLYRIITYETYDAVVVEVSTYISEDSDGNDTLMYTPTVKFTPKGSSEPITRKLGIGSGDPYYVGDSHTVAYNSDTGKIESKSLASILLLIGGLIFSLMLFSFVAYGIYYAFFDKLAFHIMDMVMIYFLYIIMPIGVLGMNAGMIYYLYERLVTGTKADDPTWVLIIVIFFVLVLSLVTVSGIKMLFSRERSKIVGKQRN